jgi:hypothetical protein
LPNPNWQTLLSFVFLLLCTYDYYTVFLSSCQEEISCGKNATLKI